MQTRLLRAGTLSLALTTLFAPAGSALAQSTVFGEGRAPIVAGEAASIRQAARQEAMRDAVIKAIKDATALDASDPRFAPIVSEVAKQLRDVQVREERREGQDFVTRVEALVDRRQIKNAIRGTDLDKLNDRSFSILMLVDEFVTSSRDLNLPLRELEEFSYDAGSSYRDKSLKASSASDSSRVAVAGSSSVNAATASSSRMAGSSSTSVAAQGRDGYGGSGSMAGAQQTSVSGQRSDAAAYSAKQNYAGAASSQSSRASIDRKDIDERNHEKMSYRKLVEYQDSSKPTGKSAFLAAFSGNLRDYDMRLQDSANTRSRFFGDRAISLSMLENGAEMTKFSEFARTKSNADFLMLGNATVVGGERNAATGQIACGVNAQIRAFATAGNELIAAESLSTQASGSNIEECAALASKKVADLMAPIFAGRALGYWADRAARGRQFTVELRGNALPLPMRLSFAKALRDIQGATDVEKKEDGDTGVKLTLTLKGKVDAMEQVYGAVSAQPAFASRTLDGKVEGEQIILCLDRCSAPASTAAAPAAKGRK